MLRTRDGKTRVEPHSGQFMKRHLSGDRRQTTIPKVRTSRTANPAPEESAKEAGLRYSNDSRPGIRRIRRDEPHRRRPARRGRRPCGEEFRQSGVPRLTSLRRVASAHLKRVPICPMPTPC